MKRILVTIIVILFFTFSVIPVNAVTTTPSPKVSPTNTSKAVTPTQTVVASKVEDLKERLATRVAELRQSSPKALFGTVSQVTVSTITIDAQNKAVKIELTDDIKVIQIIRGKRTILSSDDIDKDDKVTVFGDYDSTIDILKASTIFIENKTNPIRIHGFIGEVNKSTNTFALKGVDGQQYTIDIETTTRTQEWKKDIGIEKSGFSKLESGMFVSVLGIPDPKNEMTYTASRVLAIRTKDTPTPTVTSAITTDATKSATPTRRQTVAPTRNATPTP